MLNNSIVGLKYLRFNLSIPPLWRWTGISITREWLVLTIYQDDSDGQNIWIDFRQVQMEDNFPATVSTAGDRRIHPGEHYHITSGDMKRLVRGEYHILQYTHDGLGRIVYGAGQDSVTYDLPPGNVFFIDHTKTFQFFTPEQSKWSYMYIGFRGELAERVFEEIFARGPVHRLERSSRALAEMRQLFHHALQRNMRQCELKKAATAILLELQDAICHDGGEVEEDGFLQEVTELVQSRLAEASVAMMARHFGLSLKYFQALFKKRCSVTPGAFLMEQRLECARRLLECTEMKLSGIAENTGFADASHLCRCFRKRYGVTPDGLRRHPERRTHPDDIPLE